MKDTRDSNLVIYQSESGSLELQVDTSNETVWLTQKQMAEVFGVDVRTVNEHLQNIFASEELEEEAVIRKFRITASDGKTYLTSHYSLDGVLSVGYRVNSKQATRFRQWANRVLKQYISDGYTINPVRITHNYQAFMKAVEDIKQLGQASDLVKKSDVLELVQLRPV